MGWRRASNEPLNRRFGLLISEDLIAKLHRQAGRKQLSVAELSRQLLVDGLERLEAEEAEGTSP